MTRDSVAAVTDSLRLWMGSERRGTALVAFASEKTRRQVRDSLGLADLEFERAGTVEADVRAFVDRMAAAGGGPVSVAGLERAFAGAERDAALDLLNFLREKLAGTAAKQVWWVSPETAKTMLARAPDWTSWMMPRLELADPEAPDPREPALGRARALAKDTRSRIQRARLAGADPDIVRKELAGPAYDALESAGATPDEVEETQKEFEGMITATTRGRSSRKPVVFVSSTTRDLVAYRNAVLEAARKADFETVMMEDFERQSQKPPYPACMEKVRQCDFAVVLVAHRYGWIPPDQPGGEAAGKSITWLECEEAHREGMEVLAYIVDEKYEWPPQHKDSYRLAEAMEKKTYREDLAAQVARSIEKLDEFKEWLRNLGFHGSLTTPGALLSDVVADLGKWAQRHPAMSVPAPSGNDATAYLNQLREQVRWIDIRGLAVRSGEAHRFPIANLYIPLTMPGGAAGDLREGRGSVALETALRRRLLVIEGDPGGGKTTFLRRIVYEMCRDDGLSGIDLPVPRPKCFPIYIRVSELESHIATCQKKGAPKKPCPTVANSPEWLVHFLETRADENNWLLDGAFFKAKLDDPGTTVFLDGLDEASSTPQREAMAKLLDETARVYANCRFVATTRPASYSGASTLPDFEKVRIDELDETRRDGFLEQWTGLLFPQDPTGAASHRTALREALNASLPIRIMARNPVMLTALAVVHWNQRRLPEQRAELYEAITGWLARARESKRDGEREPAEFVVRVLGRLALEMQDRKGGRITQVERGVAADLIKEEFRHVPKAGRREKARQFLETEELDSGLFVSRGAHLRFWHLTLQEYLAARAIAGKGDDELRKLIESGKIYEPEWREVTLLLAGALIVNGTSRVDAMFAAMLLGAEKAEKKVLPDKARRVGLIGAMLRDLAPYKYTLENPSYERLLTEVLGIFDAEKSRGIDLKVRLAAAEALGQAGDPRLRLPKDPDYWVRIPAGTFTMGQGKRDDEKPHRVTLKAFDIGKYPVTVYEYAKFLEANPEHPPPPDWDEQQLHPNRPVVSVSWHDANAYCEWACCEPARVKLPTEAQWERAARGAEGRTYPWGEEAPSPERANYDKTGIGSPSPVGLFPLGSTPGEEKIADLAGNVWEWVADWYDRRYYESEAKENPACDIEPSNEAYKVLRGGSWYFPSSSLRAAFRFRYVPGYRYVDLGFRCSREVFP